ncbi:MAG TPA: YciI family protein [Solimonas sp.]|nr:YciI family protein [Solimonas sp.]
MLYAIWGVDAPDSLAGRLATRPAHVERLKALLAAGRLVIAGPRPKADAPDAPQAGFHGSLIVAEFASLAAAQDWAQADPYLAAGVYERVEVTPFVQALP